MEDALNSAEIEMLKSRFGAAGCAAKNLDDSTFEVVSDEFPVRTHVYANPYYLQLSTQILAKPKSKIPIEKVRKFLCDINLKASLVKFTMDVITPHEETARFPGAALRKRARDRRCKTRTRFASARWRQ
jgi:hypothetical protein